MLNKIKDTLKKNKLYKIETYTLVKGVPLSNENSIVTDNGVKKLENAEFLTWKYLRLSDTLEDAFIDLNNEMNNLIPLGIFESIVDTLKELNLVHTSSSETDICAYIETDCQTVINADLISDIRNKVYLKHLDMEIILTPKEYMLLKAIISGEYQTIDVKDWGIFFSLYKKEAISFI